MGPPLGRGDIETVSGNNPPLVHRVFGGVTESNEATVALISWRIEAGYQVDRSKGDLQRPGERSLDCPDLVSSERPRKATNPDGNGMDRPPSNQLHELVAGLLEREPGFDRGPMIAGELEAARIAEEVRKVQQVDVQRMAFDPLAAVEEAAESANRWIDLDPQAMLERMDGGHLVGNRADPADPGNDVDDLVRRPPDHQAFEVTRRLE